MVVWALSAWIGARCLRDVNAQFLTEFLRDASALLRPLGIKYIWTDEPRFYRTTPAGFELLAQALEARCVWYIGLSPKYPDDADAEMTFTIGTNSFSREIASTIHLFAPSSAYAEVATFVQRWFVKLDAASAFVSMRA